MNLAIRKLVMLKQSIENKEAEAKINGNIYCTYENSMKKNINEILGKLEQFQ